MRLDDRCRAHRSENDHPPRYPADCRCPGRVAGVLRIQPERHLRESGQTRIPITASPISRARRIRRTWRPSRSPPAATGSGCSGDAADDAVGRLRQRHGAGAAHRLRRHGRHSDRARRRRPVAPGINEGQIEKINGAVPNRGPHTVTGPIYVNGAEPGDVLAIHINRIRLSNFATNNTARVRGCSPTSSPSRSPVTTWIPTRCRCASHPTSWCRSNRSRRARRRPLEHHRPWCTDGKVQHRAARAVRRQHGSP